MFILPLGARERAVMVGRMELFILPLGVSERAVMVERMEVFILPLGARERAVMVGRSVYSRIRKLPVIFPPTTAHVRTVCHNARRTATRGAHQFDRHNTCQTLKTAAEHHIQITV